MQASARTEGSETEPTHRVIRSVSGAAAALVLLPLLVEGIALDPERFARYGEPLFAAIRLVLSNAMPYFAAAISFCVWALVLRRTSAAPGLEVLPDHDLTLKYDYFHLSFRRSSDLYFSPDDFHVHTPGLDYRLRFAERSVVGIEGGIPLRAGEPVGYLAGAFARIFLGERFYIEARGRIFDDTQFRIGSVTAGAGILF